MTNEKVLIINTGGTIGMVNKEKGNPLSPLIPAKSWEEIAESHPVLNALGIDRTIESFVPLLDSSNIGYADWKKMAEFISTNYDEYSGFVVLHGTDTMCYTASALSFMLENLAKPVIITGSQLPMVFPRSDAVQNLVTSIRIAAPKASGIPLIPEVCIFFRDHLLRGNRARKLSSSGYSAFGSPNFPPLGVAGERITIQEKFILPKPPEEEQFYANTAFDPRVSIQVLFPGFNPSVLKNMFPTDPPPKEEERIKALILMAFGTGNAPDTSDFLEAIEHVAKQDTIIVDITQCPEGMVELGLYEASSGLLNRGVITGVDLTPEAAVCKLMHLLAQRFPKEEVERLMQLNKAGEQSLNVVNVRFSGEAEASPMFEHSEMVPGKTDFSRLRGASIRVHGAATAGSSLALRLLLNHPRPDPNQTPDDATKDARFAVRLKRELESKETWPVDLFGDITLACRRLVKPGQLTSLAIVSETGEAVRWEHITLSLYTSTG